MLLPDGELVVTPPQSLGLIESRVLGNVAFQDAGAGRLTEYHQIQLLQECYVSTQHYPMSVESFTHSPESHHAMTCLAS